MENRNSFLLCFSWGFFLLLLTHAVAGEDTMSPWRNGILSPFEQWRAAYFCMQNVTTTCPLNYRLSLNGALVVAASDISNYCDGCLSQTNIVIWCIQNVHRHFKFQTGQPLSYVQDAIRDACAGNTNTSLNTNHTLSSATSLLGRLHLPMVSTITTVALIAAFT